MCVAEMIEVLCRRGLCCRYYLIVLIHIKKTRKVWS